MPTKILQDQDPVADIGLSNRYNRVRTIDHNTIELNNPMKSPSRFFLKFLSIWKYNKLIYFFCRIESKWSFSDIEAFASLLFCSDAFERIYNHTKQESSDQNVKIKMNILGGKTMIENGYEEMQIRNKRLIYRIQA